MGKIDISTEEKKKEIFEIFNTLKNKSQVHKYFNISDNTQGIKYINEIADAIGFDLNVYQQRSKKTKKYCKECGKEIISKWGKDFCSQSCAARYNNKHRDSSVYVNIANKLKKEDKKQIDDIHSTKEKYCAVCGKKLEGKQLKYCSVSCRNRNKYLTEGQEVRCKECGKIFKTRNIDRKFCSNECSSTYRKKEFIRKWQNGELHINPNTNLPKSIRTFLFEKKHYQCEECGFQAYNKITNNTILQIHHIDGNSGNNCEENLKVLCPNCHSMTENYMALNKGNSARNKRYKGERN